MLMLMMFIMHMHMLMALRQTEKGDGFIYVMARTALCFIANFAEGTLMLFPAQGCYPKSGNNEGELAPRIDQSSQKPDRRVVVCGVY